MALSLVGTAENAAADGASVTVTLPAGTTTDDVVYAAVGMSDNDNVDHDVAMDTSGYSELADLFANDNIEANLGVFRKVQGATPDSSYATTALVSETDVPVTSVCHVWRGANTTTPEDVASVPATGTNTGIPDPGSIGSFTTSGIVVLAIAHIGHNLIGAGGALTLSAPTNYGNLAQSDLNETNDGTTAMASRSDPGDPEDPGTFTFTETDSNIFAWAALTIALRPAAGGAAPASFPYPSTGWIPVLLSGTA